MNGLALCAGAGGLELGLRIAIGERYRCVAYVERDAYAAACLVARMEDKAMDSAPIWDDLTTFDGAAWHGCVDIISAGFPCQPWSNAGNKRGFDDERWIWPSIADIIRDVRPSYVFLENVPGLVIRDGLSPVLGRLAEMGFDAEWCVISAAAVGASHERQRAYILAYTKSNGLEERLSGASESSDVDASLPLFPPAQQGADDEWRRVIYELGRPDLVPSLTREEAAIISDVRRMADGFTFWADRIRLCGNGVVPLQAAAAFVELVSRITDTSERVV